MGWDGMGADVNAANVPSDEGRENRDLPVSLYPELDEALLTRFVDALEGGTPSGWRPCGPRRPRRPAGWSGSAG